MDSVTKMSASETSAHNTKKLCIGNGESDGGRGRWECLNPEILALIFVRVTPVEQMIQLVPLVCKSWSEVVAGPYCWTDIDIEHWCRRCRHDYRIDSVVRKLVRRSKFTFRRLSCYKLGNASFAFVANRNRFYQAHKL